MAQKKWIHSAASYALLFAASVLILLSGPSPARASESARFPNTELITQDGKKVHFYDDLIKGKIVAVDFIYTSCGYACPLQTARLVQVQQKLGDRVGKDIFFYSISIDPEHDTPKVLKAYMKKYHVGPGWTFLTGNKQQIVLLEKKLGMYTDPRINADGHVPHLLIGNDATGQWMQGSALESPSFQARMIGQFLDNFKHSNLAAEAKNSGNGHAMGASFDSGRYLFGRDCAACHTVGQGDKIGPDLLGVTSARDPRWLARMIKAPDQMFAQKDPIATALLKKYKGLKMPHVWLDDAEVNLLINYLRNETAAHDKQAGINASPGVTQTTSQAAASVPK